MALAPQRDGFPALAGNICWAPPSSIQDIRTSIQVLRSPPQIGTPSHAYPACLFINPVPSCHGLSTATARFLSHDLKPVRFHRFEIHQTSPALVGSSSISRSSSSSFFNVYFPLLPGRSAPAMVCQIVASVEAFRHSRRPGIMADSKPPGSDGFHAGGDIQPSLIEDCHPFNRLLT